jgi:hypothetical protein
VVLGVKFSRFVAVMLGVEVVGMRDMRVVGGLLVVAVLVRLGGFAMMFCGVLVVLRGLVVMIQLLFVGHDADWIEDYSRPPVIGNAINLGPVCGVPAAIASEECKTHPPAANVTEW